MGKRWNSTSINAILEYKRGQIHKSSGWFSKGSHFLGGISINPVYPTLYFSMQNKHHISKKNEEVPEIKST